MKIIITILSILGAHFSLTAVVPAEKGAWILWPFAKDTKPIFSFLQNSIGTTATQLLSAIAGACFIAAIFSIYGKFVPAEWWPYLLAAGSVSSILLYVMYLSPLAILPLLINATILYGVFARNWKVS